ncbi:hypothetical protein ACQYAD_03340 [Neobacillus sp. SM06]|uniref:hypothetical protein n=1 Tax=Neobacillus sp. SM06 TaxID=3422492 RepID=UPI003D2795C9
MDQESIAKMQSNEIERLKEEILAIKKKLQQLQGELETIQSNCKHVFVETSVMRVCQKCGLSESTYY